MNLKIVKIFKINFNPIYQIVIKKALNKFRNHLIKLMNKIKKILKIIKL